MSLFSDQSTYWDKVADSKSFSHSINTDWLLQHVPYDANILDVGCGYGRILQELHQLQYQNLNGVDYSAGMINRGKALFPHLSLQQNDGSSLPFKDNSFDTVLLFAVLTCIPHNADLEQLMQEIYRVLTPKGILYISDLLINKDERNKKRYEEFAPQYGTYGIFELPEGAVLRHFHPTYIKQLTHRFSVFQYEEKGFTTMNGNQALGFQWMGRKA